METRIGRPRNSRQKQTDASIAVIREKAAAYGLDDLDDTDWAQNLIRQGIVHRVPLANRPSPFPNIRSLDQRELLRIFQHFEDRIATVDTVQKRAAGAPQRLIERGERAERVNLEINFTDFGRGLATACGLLS